MFCFDNAFPGKSCSLSIWSFCFVLPTRFCVPECHRNSVESSTTEKVVFFFRFLLRLRREGKKFMIAEGMRVLNVKLQVGINLRKCVSNRV